MGAREGKEAESHWKDCGRKGRRKRETERMLERLRETSLVVQWLRLPVQGTWVDPWSGN